MAENQQLLDPYPEGDDDASDVSFPGSANNSDKQVTQTSESLTLSQLSGMPLKMKAGGPVRPAHHHRSSYQYGLITICVGFVLISVSFLVVSHQRTGILQRLADVTVGPGPGRGPGPGSGGDNGGLFRVFTAIQGWWSRDRGDGLSGTADRTPRPYSSISTQEKCDIPNDDHKFDCWPGKRATQAACIARGCCWQEVTTINKQAESGLSINIPYCYFPTTYEGYVVVSEHTTSNGMTAVLQRQTKSGWPDDVMELNLNVYMETDQRIHFKITDSQTKRYEVPVATPSTKTRAGNPMYKFELQEQPFGLVIKRAATGTVIFNSSVAPLVYADQFLQMSTVVPSGLVYGLGEHRSQLLYNLTSWEQLTFWTRDKPPVVGANLYGDHPFFMSLETDGSAYGVFLLNSNAMDVDLQPYPALTYRSIGGVLDFYVYLGPTPDQVVQQHTAVIGRPHLPAYWALGFHLCRWGYNDAAAIKKIINRMRESQIPYDVQWMDIDYMKDHMDWTYDKKRFSELPDIVQDLHNHNQHFVIIVDPGISSTHKGTYPPYDQGIKQGVFVTNSSGQPLIGKVWPGQTVYPDFTNPKTVEWWYQMAKGFHDKVPFDGLWTDMNEPSNFVSGSIYGCPNNKLENPPYTPAVQGVVLRSTTVCASAKQHLGSHYNVHNLYGHSEVVATRQALDKIRGPKRSLIISRSTFSGTGYYGGHWTGDNNADWDNIYYSIPAILNFQMFGIPLVGADVCGFQGDTTEELCVRWIQLGAFYPFMRNHNMQNAKAQDPAAFSETAQGSMRVALRLRYSLLPYLYTLFYQSHTQGGTVARPIFFNYPHDGTAASIDRQLMWGSGLLISPVLNQGHTTVKAYFPKDVWYDYTSGERVQSGGQWVTLQAPLDHINVHIRGGTIIPSQNPANTTVETRTKQFILTVAIDKSGSACGLLYWDDGETINATENGLYTLLQFSASPNLVVSTVEHNGYTPEDRMALHMIRVLGVSKEPSHVTVNGHTVGFSWRDKTQVLQIQAGGLSLLGSVNAQWMSVGGTR